MAFELTEREKALIRISSVERMINTTIRLVERLRRSSNAAIAEDASINWSDWREHKALVTKLWAQALRESSTRSDKGKPNEN
jgi:hypothetical protein